MFMSNSFEGGTNGIDISTANSGGASGDAFTDVVAGSGTTRKYSNTQYVHGTMSGRFATGATAASVHLQWDFTATSELYERWYVRFDTIPSAARYLREWRDTGSGQRVARLHINSTGTLALSDTTGGTSLSTTTALAADTWYRLEVRLAPHTSTGQFQLRIYSNVDSNTITESKDTGTAWDLGATTVDRSRIGWITVASNCPDMWVDDFAVSTLGWIGPALTSVSPAPDVVTTTESASVTVGGTVAKSGTDTATAVEGHTASQQTGEVGPTQFGASAWYEAEQMTDNNSWARFVSELGVSLDFHRNYERAIPTRLAYSSGLVIAQESGVDCQLTIKTDWIEGGRDIGIWASELDALMSDLEINAPTMRVAFVINNEPENNTVDPDDDSVTANAQAARWGEHFRTLARTIWDHGNPNFTVHLGFMGYNSVTRVSNSQRFSSWLSAATWGAYSTGLTVSTVEPALTPTEIPLVTVMISAFPRLDASGNISTNLEDENQTMAAQTVAMYDYANWGYARFGLETGYNADLCPTLHTKIRDAYRGYDSLSNPVSGSLGQWLSTQTDYPITHLSMKERSFKNAPDTGLGAYGTLHVDAQRFTGYANLITNIRASNPTSNDSASSSEGASVSITGTNEIAVTETAVADDWGVTEDG